MSTETKRASPKKPTVSTHRLKVSEHAALRFLERVNSQERHPRQRIREIVSNGRWVRLNGFQNPAKLLDGVAVVIDRRSDEAITVVAPRKHQLVTENDASAGWRDEYQFQGVNPGDGR